MEDSELQRLLAQLGMEKYADSFKGNNLTDESLLQFEKDDLVSIIPALGDRMKFWGALVKLRSGQQHFTKILNDGASEYGESLFSGSLISLREMADRGIKLPDLDRTALDLHTPERRNANTRVFTSAVDNHEIQRSQPSPVTYLHIIPHELSSGLQDDAGVHVEYHRNENYNPPTPPTDEGTSSVHNIPDAKPGPSNILKTIPEVTSLSPIVRYVNVRFQFFKIFVIIAKVFDF
ncbi:hypothetical protein Fcan01_27015 [Folsomia candida]|uniref:SAM domain-containing protein n=1 Tax=Folsomia candida TaxID=158441 RepID=A0A226CY22_FOLCA|nr:hypothetical protein Fcan01_27015 [Folsomia candida]